MGRLIFSFGVTSQIRGAVELEVTRRANLVKAAAKESAASQLGKYDSVRTPGTGLSPMHSYRSGFEVKNGPRSSTLMVHKQIGNRDKKANLIEFGSPGHPIGPRNAAALAWTWLGGERFVGDIGQVVQHPGTRAYLILTNAADAGR